MTEHETTTTEPSLPTQLGFDYGQLVESDQRFVQERARNIKRLWEQTTANILRIGEELSEVKARLKHGHWLPWLNAEFGWSESSANNFMRAYSVFGSSNSQRVTDLARQLAPSAVYQLAAPSTPEAARQEVLAKVAEGEIPQPKQVKATIERHKPKRAPKPKTVDGDRPPELKRVEPPKPELVEGRDYRLVEDQYGFKHREPISAAPTLTSQQYRIAGALDILVRAIVNDPTVVADLEAVIADHEKTRAEAVADADAEDIAWHDLSLSVLRHLVRWRIGTDARAARPVQRWRVGRARRSHPRRAGRQGHELPGVAGERPAQRREHGRAGQAHQDRIARLRQAGDRQARGGAWHRRAAPAPRAERPMTTSAVALSLRGPPCRWHTAAALRCGPSARADAIVATAAGWRLTAPATTPGGFAPAASRWYPRVKRAR
jgi:Protein of unknown function (DUF3102)